MKYKGLLLRGLKTSIAAVSAVAIATLLGLQFEASAGIIAILSIGDTKSLTVDIISRRIWSTVLALTIAVVMFNVFGFNLLAYGVYLAIYVPLAYILGLQVGLGPCSVLVTHLHSVHSTAMPILLNEVGLMIIGSLTAFVANSYMLSYEKTINELIKEINKEIVELLNIFDSSLCNKKTVDDAHFDKVNSLIDEALEICKIEMENRFLNAGDYRYNYIIMRQSQVQTLDKMQELINLLSHQTKECYLVGLLFGQLGENIEKVTPDDWIIDETQREIDTFKDNLLKGDMEDPTSTTLLFAILNLFEEILEDKRNFYNNLEESPNIDLS